MTQYNGNSAVRCFFTAYVLLLGSVILISGIYLSYSPLHLPLLFQYHILLLLFFINDMTGYVQICFKESMIESDRLCYPLFLMAVSKLIVLQDNGSAARDIVPQDTKG